MKKNSFVNYRQLLKSNLTPGISVIAPAYNESQTIIDNIRSLLSLNYTNFEVIIVNDGSSDNTLQLIIEEYDLVAVEDLVDETIETKPILGVYKSTNHRYFRLVVIDKANGGKADALNAGINISINDIICCIDVDCILEQDALLRMIKPFLEEDKKVVIASGGVVRIANSCLVEGGKIQEVNLPSNYYARLQVLEYIRAFLLGRMAWTKLNGLLIISGAFGFFNKKIVKAVGGYSTKTVGEDMELVIRMRRYMEEQKVEYMIDYIPDPLCWTECPEDPEILRRQRNRWTRGTIQSLWEHRKLFFNPNYRILGIMSFPYWAFYEWFASILEVVGFILFICLWYFDLISWSYFISLTLLVLSFAWMYSCIAILTEELTYHQYNTKDVWRLIKSCFSEPIMYHPLVVMSAIKGNWKHYFGDSHGWGKQIRTGFGGHQKSNQEEFTVMAKERDWDSLVKGLTASFRVLVVWSIVVILLRSYDYFLNARSLNINTHSILFFLFEDIKYFFKSSVFILISYLFTFKFSIKWCDLFSKFLIILLTIKSLLVIQFFNSSKVLLGSEILDYTFQEIKQTVGASGELWSAIVSVVVLIVVLLLLFKLVNKIKGNDWAAQLMFIISVIFFFFINKNFIPKPNLDDEFTSSWTINKASFISIKIKDYCTQKLLDKIGYSDGFQIRGSDIHNEAKYIDPTTYPFLRSYTPDNILSKYFEKGNIPPNIVVILVEGLGKAFSGKNAYLGSYTPYLDELAKKSLYWENALSASGRTFGSIPTISASLPFCDKGFAEMSRYPEMYSVFELLKPKKYTYSFLTGTTKEFDNFYPFLTQLGVDEMVDENTVLNGNKYHKLPPNQSGFSWGWDDESLYNKYLEIIQRDTSPNFSIILTTSTHHPFNIRNQTKYIQKAYQLMDGQNIRDNDRQRAKEFSKALSTVVYADECIKNMIEQFEKLPEFENTIFVISGDHRIPEIPMSTVIDQFHVPLIIYSKLLKKSNYSQAIVSHFDLMPSLMSLMKTQYGVYIPKQTHWIGMGLDDYQDFRNINHYPLKKSKSQLIDFVSGEFLLHDNELYKINPKMDVEPIEDDTQKQIMIHSFEIFKQKNKQIAEGKNLIKSKHKD